MAFQLTKELRDKIEALSKRTITKKKKPGQKKKDTDLAFRAKTQQNKFGEQIYGSENEITDQAIETAKSIIKSIAKFKKEFPAGGYVFIEYKCGQENAVYDEKKPIFNLLNFIRKQDDLKNPGKNE